MNAELSCQEVSVLAVRAPRRVVGPSQTLRILAVLIGFFEFIAFRNVIFSDGISYLEIARHYAAGEWSTAMNGYWSPLLSWLLAIPMKWPGIPEYWELTALHGIIFIAYLAGLVLVDRLAVRMGQAFPHHSAEQLRTWYVSVYVIYLWAALFCVRLNYCSPDMLVLAIVIGLVLVMLGLIQGRSGKIGFWLIGVLLGLGYFAKTAMLPLAPIYLAGLGWELRRRKLPLSGLLRSVAALLILIAPFLLVLRWHTGHWTIGESGSVNYSWEVDGAARSTHWQGEPGDIGTPLHPTRRLLTAPEVYEFNTSPAVTYSPWYDPSWWYAGLKPHLHLENETRSLARYGAYSTVLLFEIPGVAPMLLIAGYRRLMTRTMRGLASTAWLSMPAIAAICMYSAVFVDRRYIAGALTVIGLGISASTIPLLDKSWLRAVRIGAVATLLACHGVILLCSVVVGAHDLVLGSCEFTRPRQYECARELQDLGLRPGERVGYIGLSISAYWALLDRVQIVAEVPVKYARRGGLENRVRTDLTEVDRFWSGSPEKQQEVLRIMRKAGARAVVADMVPPGANVAGWHRLRTQLQTEEERNGIYVRFLE